MTENNLTGDLKAESIDQETGENINFNQNQETSKNTKGISKTIGISDRNCKNIWR
ncbi:hypothetical protein [Anabaena azotica]|uniref:hypothetical protein n=1 Tax=Anabaena azotica TaxID=197653 RepID=UPI0039A67417